MVRHIVMWELKEEIADNDREVIKSNAKKNLEGLVGKIPGLIEATVITEPLPSSTHDMILITDLSSEEDLKAYQAHPDHVATANTFVRPYTCNRACYDWIV